MSTLSCTPGKNDDEKTSLLFNKNSVRTNSSTVEFNHQTYGDHANSNLTEDDDVIWEKSSVTNPLDKVEKVTEEDTEEEEDDEEKEENKRFKFSQLPRQSKYLVLLCAAANFASSISYTVSSAFFPQTAEKKNISEDMVGFYFSSYEIVVFMTSPIFGLYLTKIGPRFLVMGGIFVSGVASIIFGFLETCPPGTPFLLTIMFNSALVALGNSAFITALQVIVLNELKGNEGFAFSMMEGSAGVGCMVGPAVGGVLFDLGGFGLPFFTVGGFVTICGVFLYFVLPPIKEVKKTDQPSVFRILLHPLTWVTMPCIAMVSLGFGFLDPTLANHMAEFDLSYSVIGLFFLVASLSYFVATPVWGKLSDSKKIGRGKLLVVGATATGITFMMIGPSPWISSFFPFAIWSVILSLVIMGMSQPSGMIPTITCLTTAAVETGLEDNFDTYGMVVGLYNFSYCVGAAAGPLLGGVLVEHYGFPIASTSVAFGNFAMAIVCFIYFLIRSRVKSKLSKTADDLDPDVDEECGSGPVPRYRSVSNLTRRHHIAYDQQTKSAVVAVTEYANTTKRTFSPTPSIPEQLTDSVGGTTTPTQEIESINAGPSFEYHDSNSRTDFKEQRGRNRSSATSSSAPFSVTCDVANESVHDSNSSSARPITNLTDCFSSSHLDSHLISSSTTPSNLATDENTSLTDHSTIEASLLHHHSQ